MSRFKTLKKTFSSILHIRDFLCYLYLLIYTYLQIDMRSGCSKLFIADLNLGQATECVILVLFLH